MAKATKRGRPVIRIERRGPTLAVKNVSRRVFCALHDMLTYEYVEQIRGKEAKKSGRTVKVKTRHCYRYVEDEDGLVPPQIMTNAGWYPQIRERLTRMGYAVKYQDKTPESRGGAHVLVPQWHRLQSETWKYRQRETLEQIVAKPYGRIICPTGYGKSFLIRCLAILYPKARFVVSTHSVEVIEMLYDDLADELPSVGLITGSKKILNKRVMCVSGKSLHRDEVPADTDFFLVDEMQEFATQDYMEKMARFWRCRPYGFSANPIGDRNDGADFELEGVFGPELINIPYEDAVKHGAVVQIKVRWADVVMDVNPCEGFEEDTARQRNGLWRNKQRNQTIADVAREYKDEQVLITVETIEHACFLKKLLPEFTLVYSEAGLTPEKRERYIRWGLLPQDEPKMTPDRRWKIKKAFEAGKLRKAIATTVWNRGVNFRQLQVLIRCDARASAVRDKQIPGRLSRLSADKDYGLLVDFYDQFDKSFARKATDRKRQYKKLHWEMIEPDDSDLTRAAQGSLFV